MLLFSVCKRRLGHHRIDCSREPLVLRRPYGSGRPPLLGGNVLSVTALTACGSRSGSQMKGQQRYADVDTQVAYWCEFVAVTIHKLPLLNTLRISLATESEHQSQR